MLNLLQIISAKISDFFLRESARMDHHVAGEQVLGSNPKLGIGKILN
jgi:hypothetical protein